MMVTHRQHRYNIKGIVNVALFRVQYGMMNKIYLKFTMVIIYQQLFKNYRIDILNNLI